MEAANEVATYFAHEGKKIPDLIHFDEVRKMFKYSFQENYNQEGYNILFGSEEIDRVVKPSSNSTLIDEIVSLLPKEVYDHKDELLSTLVVYRGPRSQHLRSVWGELYNKNAKKPVEKTFREFLCDDMLEEFHKLDTLALARELLEKDLKVKLFDMTSMSKEYSENVEVFSVLACDVMGLKCEKDIKYGLMLPEVIFYHPDKDGRVHKLSKK